MKEGNMRKTLGLIVGMIFVLGLSASAWAVVDVPVSEYKKWPNNWGKWGPDDEVGMLNYCTPQTLIDAAKLIKQGKIIKCSWECAPNSYPLWGARVGIRRYMNWSGKDAAMADKPGMWYSDEIITVGTHSMTHVDPLVHLWYGDKCWNGWPVKDVIFHDKGTIKGNANAYIPKSAMRGVLLDVAKFKGVDYLGDKYLITPKDLDDCAKWAKVKIQPGDAILIRTGFMKHWSDKIIKSGGTLRWSATQDGHPGPGGACIKWVQDNKIGLWGADNIAFEHIVPVEPEVNKTYKVGLVPLHVAVLSMLGCPFQELLNLDELSEDCAKDGIYEFFYVWTPLNFWNATGGLISPIAIK
jgi:kynurenine formamidase